MDDGKKLERKRKRFAARLKSSRDINCTDTPGPNIILCNAGRATGYEKEDLIELFETLDIGIQIPKFIAEKTETYSFLEFKRTEDAVSFFKTCNGKLLSEKFSSPVYLYYVEKDSIPNLEIICTHNDPEGLTILNDFITRKEEESFIKLFDLFDGDAGNLKNRQVKHYGYAFRYGTNDVDLDCPLSEKIPIECDLLFERLVEHGFKLGRPDQLTVNKYSPGHGIPSHVDRHSPFGETILVLSLGSSVVMHWKHHSGVSVPTVIPRRSMIVMQGEIRYDWQHGIHNTNTDPIIEQRVDPQTQKTVKVITSDTQQRKTRISLTFRWTRKGPCECGFKTLCDTAANNPTEIEDSVAAQIEELHVHQVYEQIASHFSSTRHTAWPRVVRFCRGLAPGDLLLDLGAGNGKNLLHRNDILQIAGERSQGLLLECLSHTRHVAGAERVRLDALHAPLRDRVADAVVCIAVIHHMTTEARRLKALSTIHRVLRAAGRALVTVWARDQTRSNYLNNNKVAGPNAQHTVNGLNLHVHENRTQFQHKDLLVPWKLNDKCQGKNSRKPVDKSISGNVVNSVSKSAKHKNSAKSEYDLIKSDSNSVNSDSTSMNSDNVENTLLRFYHVFEEGELDDLCKKVGFVIEETFYEEGNWCVICKKL